MVKRIYPLFGERNNIETASNSFQEEMASPISGKAMSRFMLDDTIPVFVDIDNRIVLPVKDSNIS